MSDQPQAQPQMLPSIHPADVDGLTAQGWRLIDVRTDGEWDEGRIDGALHVPLHEVVARFDEIGDQVIFVCAVGGRSGQATAYAVAQGREAVNLVGGVQAWAAEGRSLVR